jgi:serine/threonine protein phosphatase PrpC
MSLQLRSAAVSHLGLVRSGNQDSVYAGQWLIAVADGMGGMAAGDLASAIAIDAITPVDRPTAENELVPSLHAAIGVAGARMRAAVAEDSTRDGMGTTLTAMLLSGSGSSLALAHIGDSRAYLMRDGLLEQLTKDDTYVQLLLDEGLITAEQATSHPRRAVVTKAVQGEDIEPSYLTAVPRVGDRWLLCSDGLSNVVRDESLASVLASYPGLDESARRLVDLALRAGGPDNISVIVAEIVAA